MSTRQQVRATPGADDRSSSLGWSPTSAPNHDVFFGASSEPGIAPVERSRASSKSLHWPEFAMEGALLGLFMISACAFTAILQLPYSPIHAAVSSPVMRQVLTGAAMGMTAIALI